ncbi:MAG: ROK family protein [Gemmatimonadota bacterium]|nr:MAG: ROK family protein [Gemmatimonadota bacterium]
MRDHVVGHCTGRWAIAVDLGGTWIRAAAVSESGTIGPIRRRETLAARPYGEILADVLYLVGEAARDAAARKGVVAGAGIGVATVLERGGRTVPCPTLPTLGNLELGDRMRALARMPVAVENDASCFALGESWMGVGKGCTHLCGITLGTGIGVGIVIAGHIYSGSHGFAGEVWRTPTGDGHLEDHVSGRAIEQHYAHLSGKGLSGAEIAELAAAGDPTALAAFLEFGRWLGMTVAFLVNALDPEVVVLGGSIAGSFDHFRQPVREALAKTTSPETVRLECSTLGESAALFGAARMLWDQLDH